MSDNGTVVGVDDRHSLGSHPAFRVIHVDQQALADGHAGTFWQSISDDGDQCIGAGGGVGLARRPGPRKKMGLMADL